MLMFISKIFTALTLFRLSFRPIFSQFLCEPWGSNPTPLLLSRFSVLIWWKSIIFLCSIVLAHFKKGQWNIDMSVTDLSIQWLFFPFWCCGYCFPKTTVGSLIHTLWKGNFSKLFMNHFFLNSWVQILFCIILTMLLDFLCNASRF